MTDKVQKIREEVEKLKSQLLRGACSSQIAMETICKEEAYNEVLAILDTMQEEPVKRTPADVESAMQEVEEKSRVFTEAHKGEDTDTILAQMRGEEPVSEDLGKVGSLKSLEYYPEKKTTNKTSKGVFDANMPRRKAYLRGFKDGAHAHKELIANKPVSEELEEASKEWLRPQLDKSYANYGEAKMMELTHFDGYAMFDAIDFGAKWHKKHLWKSADGDDLPIIDREVIALLDNGKVVYAHRPPEYWDGKDIITGKVTRNYPKTYDKGGWNVPDIAYWLDVKLPKEIEL